MSKRTKLAPIERLIIQQLKKILPEEAYCAFSYHRHLSWGYRSMRLGIKPEASQNSRLHIGIPRSKDPHGEWDNFNWEGADLQKGLAELAQWIQQLKKMLASGPINALNASNSDKMLACKQLGDGSCQ